MWFSDFHLLWTQSSREPWSWSDFQRVFEISTPADAVDGFDEFWSQFGRSCLDPHDQSEQQHGNSEAGWSFRQANRHAARRSVGWGWSPSLSKVCFYSKRSFNTFFYLNRNSKQLLLRGKHLMSTNLAEMNFIKYLFVFLFRDRWFTAAWLCVALNQLAF